MTSTTGNKGRFGNQFIRNLAVSLIAEKYNLNVDYYNKHLFNKLGINLFSGINTYNNIQSLTDNNYFTIYNCDNLNYDLNPNDAYFQTKEFTNFLYNYLHKDIIKSNIIEKNPVNERYNKNNDLFIHIRLGDASIWNPGITYYINAIKNIKFDNETVNKYEHRILQRKLIFLLINIINRTDFDYIVRIIEEETLKEYQDNGVLGQVSKIKPIQSNIHSGKIIPIK